jgi:putative transposase
VLAGCPHHITQRGNNRQDVFFVDDDRRVFLDLLRDASAKFGLKIEGYCLMTNHVHLVAIPRKQDALHLTLKRVNQIYTQHMNRLHGRSGHLWQDRFFSCPLDDEHFWTAMVYVERNPLRAKLAARAWQYPWSSAAAHCGSPDQSGLLPLDFPERFDAVQWKTGLTQPQDDKILSQLRLSTSRGRPLGTDSFISKLEKLLGRRLRPLPNGRPRKDNDEN